MIRKIGNNLLKYIKIIVYGYSLYRLINILIVIIISSMNISSLNNTLDEENAYYVNFEYPAPNINEVIDYKMLGWCHRCLINENEYMNYDNYTTIEKKINASFILFPWTIPIDVFSPDNSKYRHQYNKEYDIAVWCGRNVFSGEKEELFFFYNNSIILFPIFIVVIICNMFYDIKKILRKYPQKT